MCIYSDKLWFLIRKYVHTYIESFKNMFARSRSTVRRRENVLILHHISSVPNLKNFICIRYVWNSNFRRVCTDINILFNFSCMRLQESLQTRPVTSNFYGVKPFKWTFQLRYCSAQTKNTFVFLCSRFPKIWHG